MGKNLKIVVLLSALSLTASGCAMNQCGCGDACGCGSCGCDDPCGCQCGDYCSGPSCGCGEFCEPACGCGGGCCSGRDYAGDTWDCCHEEGPKLCGCTGPTNCCETSCNCGDGCCEPACGCGGYCDEPCGCGDYCGDCCEPTCGCDSCCEPSCGCGSTCGSPYSCSGWFDSCERFCKAMFGSCGGCTGCSSECYWSEWHNDPPRCCDPCDRCGNWIGPSAGYQAPYNHPYSPYEVSKHESAVPGTRTVQRPTSGADQSYQR